MSVPAKVGGGLWGLLIWMAVEISAEVVADRAFDDALVLLDKWVRQGADQAIEKLARFFDAKPEAIAITLARATCLLSFNQINDHLRRIDDGTARIGMSSPYPRSITRQQYNDMRAFTCARERRTIAPAPAPAAAPCMACGAAASALYLGGPW